MIEVVSYIRTWSALNERCHWSTRARRAKHERHSIGWLLAGKTRPEPPIRVVMTRRGPTSGLDDDNLAGALKGIRDGIATWLGIDDGDQRITWVCKQQRMKMWSVLVQIVPRTALRKKLTKPTT